MLILHFGSERHHLYKMNFLFRTQLFPVILFVVSVSCTESKMIKCTKKDECSCVTDTKPQLQVSLWKMGSKKGIYERDQRDRFFDVNLCFGVHMESHRNETGCPNSTVCQYNRGKPGVFEIGKYGTAYFHDYNNETKSIQLDYYGTKEENVTRAINITLCCKPNRGSASYEKFGLNVPSTTLFEGTIETEAACLSPVPKPTPAPSETSHNGGLKTIYIVLIAVGSVLLLVVVGLLGYKSKRKRSILEEEEDDGDYGTCSEPSLHIQNAFSPSSKPMAVVT